MCCVIWCIAQTSQPSHHDGYWWPGAYLMSGHQQPLWWFRLVGAAWESSSKMGTLHFQWTKDFVLFSDCRLAKDYPSSKSFFSTSVTVVLYVCIMLSFYIIFIRDLTAHIYSFRTESSFQDCLQKMGCGSSPGQYTHCVDGLGDSLKIILFYTIIPTTPPHSHGMQYPLN